MKYPTKITRITLLLLLGLSAGCTTLKSTDDTSRQISNDPLEGVNRAVYGFNTTADKVILRPVAKAYSYTVPKPVKTSISNFFNNLREPVNIVNNALQGKGYRALDSGYRFLINSSIGMLGLFEVANHYNIKPAREDFGQTLAAWGVKPGPYVMVPFLGPTNFRDGFGRIVQSSAYYAPSIISDSDTTQIALTAVDVVDTRADFLGLDSALDLQLDKYLFFKEAFEADRINKIYDGNAPVQQVEYDF